MLRHKLPNRISHENACFLLLIESFQSRGQIYGVSDHRELHSLRGTNIADDHTTVVQSDSHFEGMLTGGSPTRVKIGQPLLHGPPCS